LASKQTYYIIRFLVDRDRTLNAYRAYAYFRWLDDRLDTESLRASDRIAIVERQSAIIDQCYKGSLRDDITSEEQMLVDLIRSDHELESGLQSYIRHLMAVMTFDAHRCGRLITQIELNEYSWHLAVAVTEALHYFIGHNDSPLPTESRYFAATAAHIAHMLRDTYEDTAATYFNVPCEYLFANNIQPLDIESEPYRAWVEGRVVLARAYFEAGKRYILNIQNWRCRLAGYAYIARFEYILDIIARENFKLRANYKERHSLRAALTIGWSIFRNQFGNPLRA
jgi:hypothetical protein